LRTTFNELRFVRIKFRCRTEQFGLGNRLHRVEYVGNGNAIVRAELRMADQLLEPQELIQQEFDIAAMND
jgi:hypothetical protein